MLRRQPLFELALGLLAVAIGVGFGVMALVNGERWTTAIATSGLVVLGAVWIAVFTEKRGS